MIDHVTYEKDKQVYLSVFLRTAPKENVPVKTGGCHVRLFIY